MLETYSSMWGPDTLHAKGSEVFANIGEFFSTKDVDWQVNLRGAGWERTEIKRVNFRYAGAEKYSRPYKQLRRPLVLRSMSLINCTIDLRFVSFVHLEDVFFYGCTLTGFAWWDSVIDKCRFVKSRIILQDGVEERKGNRGGSNALTIQACTFENIEDGPAIYLGSWSRVCKVVATKFDDCPLGAIKVHPHCMEKVVLPIHSKQRRWREGDPDVCRGEHQFHANSYRGCDEPNAEKVGQL